MRRTTMSMSTTLGAMKAASAQHHSDEDDEAFSEDDAELSEDDAQQPRYAAYHGESDEEDDDDDEEDTSDEHDDDGEADEEVRLRQQLGSLPLSALLKARTAMEGEEGGDQDADDGSDDEDATDDSEDDADADGVKRPRKELSKRVDKSAPTEISSKRAVSRRRQVVDVPKSRARDPRFDSLSTSPLNADIFKRTYSFIDDTQSHELQTLRKQYADLRRAVAARCPSDERARAGKYSDEAMAIRAERDRVGAMIKRLESVASEKERRARETEVKRNLRKVNEERQKEGRAPVYLKRAQLKGVLLQDKFERLASQGSKGKGKDKDRTAPNARSATTPSTASNMSVDRLRSMIATNSSTVPAALAAGSGGSAEATGSALSSSNAAIRKLMVRKAQKEARKERKEAPFLVRDRGGGSGGGGGGDGGGARGKKRHRGSRGSKGGSAKKARAQ